MAEAERDDLDELHLRLAELCSCANTGKNDGEDENLKGDAEEILDAAEKLLRISPEGTDGDDDGQLDQTDPFKGWLDRVAAVGHPHDKPTCLHLCAQNAEKNTGIPSVIALILSRGADPTLKAGNYGGGTLGTISGYVGNAAAIRALVEFPESLRATDDARDTCAHELAMGNHAKCIEVMFEALPRGVFRELFAERNRAGQRPQDKPDACDATRELIQRLVSEASLTKSANKT
jgi:hypothetical protein